MSDFFGTKGRDYLQYFPFSHPGASLGALRRHFLSLPLQLYGISRWAYRKRLDLPCPSVERHLFLIVESMALVDANDSCTGTRYMPQNGFYYFKPEAESLQPSRNGTTQVVEPPCGKWFNTARIDANLA